MLSIAVSPVSPVAVSALYAHISSFSTYTFQELTCLEPTAMTRNARDWSAVAGNKTSYNRSLPKGLCTQPLHKQSTSLSASADL
jgi:hypothetical protein